jgi:hypothetical protein
VLEFSPVDISGGKKASTWHGSGQCGPMDGEDHRERKKAMNEL